MYSKLYININIMKYANKVIASIAIVALSFYGITYSGDLGVDEIKVIDSETLSVTLSENPNLGVGEIQGEVTILNDLELRWGFKVEDDAYVVELLLEDALLANTTYSLLTVSGDEGSIDFTTGSEVEWFSVNNIASSDDQDIDGVEIIDDRTVRIEYRQELTSSLFEYKLLAESKIIKLEKPDYFIPEIIINVEPPFISEQDYILMFIDMQDMEGNYLEFDTGIYDFTTPNLEVQDDLGEEDTIDEVLEVIEINNENEENMVEEGISLDAAGDEVSLEKQGESDIDVLAAATMVTETPDTWAQTWVLILLTLVINSFYYLSRRNRKLFAL